jgi:hypothetical protein
MQQNSPHRPMPARWPLTPGRVLCWGSQETLPRASDARLDSPSLRAPRSDPWLRLRWHHGRPRRQMPHRDDAGRDGCIVFGVRGAEEPSPQAWGAYPRACRERQRALGLNPLYIATVLLFYSPLKTERPMGAIPFRILRWLRPKNVVEHTIERYAGLRRLNFLPVGQT